MTAFLSSALAGDCATAEDLVTPAYLKSEGRCTTSDLPSDFGSKAKYTVGKASVKGSTATVPIRLTYAGKDDRTDRDADPGRRTVAHQRHRLTGAA
ncbi:hypothetical protein G5V59_20410 [Nocardioides sp. W3-2-3]|uniref:hypothetical protein n=1 Tax=Nocardioides convexus TaxID=2712224 RepID=UPI0024181497|nr:hypothetical protein [Nocardioides convexus]NHA01401.1 hypothetical protein [Nocardioides convexus]